MVRTKPTKANPRLNRAVQENAAISSDDLVSLATPYLDGWIETLGEAGKPTRDADGTITSPGNVSAAVSGLKILQDYISQRGYNRAEKVLEKAQRARKQSIKELAGDRSHGRLKPYMGTESKARLILPVNGREESNLVGS